MPETVCAEQSKPAVYRITVLEVSSAGGSERFVLLMCGVFEVEGEGEGN